jgi:hypothetical protein
MLSVPRRPHGFACLAVLLPLAASACNRASKSYGGDGSATAASPSADSPASPSIQGTLANSAGSEPPSTNSSPTDDLHATSGESMKLLDAGQPPRRKLRYDWHLDQKEQLSMDLRTAVSTEGAGAPQAEVPLPSVHILIAVDPQSITPDRDLRYAWRVTSASVDAADETPAQVAEGIRAEVAEITRLSGNALVTSRGLAKEVTIDSQGSGKPSGTGQMAEQVRQTLRDVAAPLPEEPVGVGARWRKLSQLDEKDALVTQAETFRLAELQGDRGVLDDALAQTAPPQALPAPGSLHGARARMESMLASGQAKVRFDLSRLVPQTAFDGTTQMVLSGQIAGDVARNVRTVMHVYYAIAGSRR